jgi:hypothetical protein
VLTRNPQRGDGSEMICIDDERSIIGVTLEQYA